jgi:hypothetical protein
MVATQQVREKCGMSPKQGMACRFDSQKAMVMSMPRLLRI